jgi:hypothetical protein
MILQKKKRMASKHGTLYTIEKLIDEKFEPIIFTLNNASLLFNIQRTSNKIYLKWKSNSMSGLSDILDIETAIKNFFNKNIASNIIEKNNYPKHVSTQIKVNKNGSDIINDTENSTKTYEEYITKNNRYNLILEIKNVFEKDTVINYTINIKKISLAF